MSTRRSFITLLGGAAAWPLAVRAQPADRVRRIGVMMALSESDSETQSRVTVLRENLQKLGWIEGRNLLLDFRWDVSDPDRARIWGGPELF